MPEFSECTVCGSTQYSLDNGMYFCDTCGAALLDVSQMVDAHDYSRHDIDEDIEVTTTPGSAPIFGRKGPATKAQKYFLEYTSWEVYNYTLKGWVDELICMGVDPQLKIVALQVWAKVLSLSRIAFFSEDKTEKPRLSLRASKIDAQILYGVKNIKRDLFGIASKSFLLRGGRKLEEKRKRESLHRITNTKNLRKDLMKLHKKEQENAALEASQMSQTLDNLMVDEFAEQQKTVLLNPQAKKSLDEAIKNEAAVDTNIKDDITQINLTTLIAILRVALIIINADLLVSDLFRLAEDKFLSLFDLANVVPENVLANCDPQLYNCQKAIWAPRPDAVSQKAAALLRHMNITYRPNLGQICARYCQELQLPIMVVEWTQLIIKLYPVTEIVYTKKVKRDYKSRYDVVVMACIIFVMKLFFSLDDVTEYEQSEVAALINKKIKKKKLEEPLLFEWNEWREYVTCRKSIIALHHYPTFTRLHRDSMFEANILLNHWQKLVLPPNVRRSSLADVYSSLLKTLDSSLEVKTDDKLVLPDLNLKPSLTPFSGYLEQLLTHHPDHIPPAIQARMKQNFSATSVKFLAEESYLQKLAEKCDIQIPVRNQVSKLLSVKKIKEIQRLDRFPTEGPYGFPIKTPKALVPFFVPGKSKRKRVTQCSVLDLNSLDLPPEAAQILKDRLQKCKVKVQTISPPAKKMRENNEVSLSSNEVCDAPKSSKSSVLNKTMKNYWILHMNPWKTYPSDVAEFDTLLTKLFPSSFVWLLKECCFLLDCKTTDLYREICDVEDMILNTPLPCDNSSKAS